MSVQLHDMKQIGGQRGAPQYTDGAPITLHASDWTLVADALLSRIETDWLTMVGQVGAAGALTDLRLTAQATPNGPEVDVLENTDFNEASAGMIPRTSKTSTNESLNLTPANGIFWFTLEPRAFYRLRLYARGASSTTLTVDLCS